MTYPVIYAPGGDVIGKASTERGAIQCAGGIVKASFERWTASLRETLDRGDMADFTLAWFVGPQLRTRTVGL